MIKEHGFEEFQKKLVEKEGKKSVVVDYDYSEEEEEQ
jgi:hypothetical protein